MKITSFDDVEAQGYDICFFHSGCDGDADVIILDINTIFDYEEKKHDACKKDFTSIAIIDDPSDYDAFKNFGITAWIKRDDLSKLPELLGEVKKKDVTIIIDSHIHLDNEQYIDDVDDVITTALKEGIESFIIPGADPKDLPKAVELSEKYDEVYFAVGVHPYDCEDFDLDVLEKYVNHPKCVAVGECGLDYFRLPEDPSEKEANVKLQKEVFASQIEFAKKVNKPLIVHVREASNDSRTLLVDHNAKEVGGVLHCFNASEHLLPLAEHDFYFGIGGVLTFKNAKKLVEILPKIPLDKIVVETDGPYLTPHPNRGKRNEPKYTKLVVEKIAELLSKEPEEIANITTQNSKKLFKI